MSGARACLLIPAWKDQAGLSRTLELLGRESYPFDIVVVDDGSPEPIRCPPRAGDHAVRLVRLAHNRGIEHALNAGLRDILARGYDYVGRLDCGDLAMPGRIERQVRFLDDASGVAAVGTWARCVDDSGAYLFTLRFPAEDAKIRRHQRYAPGLLHPSVMIRAETLKRAGPYSDAYPAAEDYDLFVRLGRLQCLANIPEALTEYTVSEGGTTARRRRRTLSSRLKVQWHNFSWRDPHASLGLLRTLAFMAIPFGWLVALKRLRWQ